MTKRYDEPIEVSVVEGVGNGNGTAPAAFSWRGRRYSIHERLATWFEAGEWWRAAERRDREYHRVLARPADAGASGDVDPDGFLIGAPGAVYDVYLDRVQGSWRLARVWD